MKKKKTKKEIVALSLVLGGIVLLFTPLLPLGFIALIVGAFIMASVKFAEQKVLKKELTAGELLPGETTVYVRGVSYKQANIRKLPKALEFTFKPEPNNKFDKNAVAVMAITPQGLIAVGYLPADDEFTELAKALSEKLASEDSRVKVAGRVHPYDGGLGVTLDIPHESTLKRRLKA